MLTMNYSDARAKLAELLKTASEQPVTITRRSAPDVVVISAKEYEAFQQAKFEAALGRMEALNGETLKVLADK